MDLTHIIEAYAEVPTIITILGNVWNIVSVILVFILVILAFMPVIMGMNKFDKYTSRVFLIIVIGFAVVITIGYCYVTMK